MTAAATQRERAQAEGWLAEHFPAHPVLPRPSAGQVLWLMRQPDGEPRLTALYRDWHGTAALMKSDPLNHGWEPECWRDARRLLAAHDELLIQGGNRAGKTELAAKLVVETLVRKEEANAWCLHSTQPSSVEMQQPVIHRMLPPDWRNMGKRGRVANISYTKKNGFSEQVFVTPQGGRCRFLNYSMDRQVIEGGELDVIWCDELVPYDWVDTLRYRLVTRRGKLILTFTPVNGFSLVVKDFVSGSVTREWRDAPLLPPKPLVTDGGRPGPPGRMPYIRACAKPERAVIYFFTAWNPFSDYANMSRKLEGLSEEHIKIRAYGYTERMETAMFPKFGDAHIVAPARVPAAGTNYCVCDPAGTKNWFIKWYRVTRVADDIEHVHLYREWPDHATHGEWALPGDKPEGRAGPAQRAGGGRGILDYKRLILEAEGWERDEAGGVWRQTARTERIEDRVIDPRFGGAEMPTAEDSTSIIDMMADEQRDAQGRVTGPSLIWRPAQIHRGGAEGRTETSHQKIVDLMDYHTGQPLSALNAPRWYVSAACVQSIYAYREFTGCGAKEHLKDVIDCDRYFVASDCHYVDPKQPLSRGGGSY